MSELSAAYLAALKMDDLNKAAQIRGDMASLDDGNKLNDLLSLANEAEKLKYSIESIKIYRICAELYPESADAWFKKGMSLLGTKHFEEARDAFEFVLNLDPSVLKFEIKPNAYGIVTKGCYIDDQFPSSSAPVFEIVSKNKTVSVSDISKFKASIIVLGNCQITDYEACFKQLMFKIKLCI